MRATWPIIFFVLYTSPISAHMRWVLLQISESDVSILQTKPKNYNLDLEHLYSKAPLEPLTHHTLDVFIHTGDNRHHSHRMTDPRIRHYDVLDDNDDMLGLTHMSNVSHTVITVPQHATHLSFHRHGKFSWQATVPLPADPLFVHGKFKTLQEEADVQQTTKRKPIRTVINQAGDPGKHKNIVFLSAGYTANEEDKFYADVDRCAKFLQGTAQSRISPAPWHRYWPLINVFAAWEPSVDSGASYPAAPDGTGGHPELGPLSKDNNLGCEYGASADNLRLLNCDIIKMHVLSSWTEAVPEKTINIALVNDGRYGGTGGGRYASIYTGLSMLYVLIHELGHADTNLMDEYDYHFVEPKQLSLPNCHWSATENLPWQHWVGQPLGVGAPVAKCSYSNYYKPTKGKCVMEVRSGLELCAVCAEQTIRSIYRDTESLASPRCPREQEQMVITDADETHWLYVSKSFFTPPPDLSGLAPHWDGTPLRIDNGEVKTTWSVPHKGGIDIHEGMWASPVTRVPINGRNLGVSDQPHEIRLNVLDKTQFVKLPPTDPLWQQMNYTTTFRVLVVPQSSNRYKHCRVAELMQFEASAQGDPLRWTETAKENNLNRCTDIDDIQANSVYCSICDTGKVCNESYKIAPSEAKVNPVVVVETMENWLTGTGGIISGSVIGGLVVIALIIGFCFRRSVQDVIPLSPFLQTGRVMIMILCALAMVSCAVVAVVAIWQYGQVNAYEKPVIILAVIIALLIFATSLLGFTGALFRNNFLLAVHGFPVSLVTIILVVAMGVVLYWGVNVDSEDWKQKLEGHWVSQVSKRPRLVCTFQSALKCSGFTWSCHRWEQTNSQCPINCENTNGRYANPCYFTLVEEVKKLYVPAGFGLLISAVFVGFMAVVTWLLVWKLRQRRRMVHERLHRIPLGIVDKTQWELSTLTAVRVLKNLEPEEVAAMEKEFKKIDKNKDNRLSAKELQIFIKKTTGEDVPESDFAKVMAQLEGAEEGKEGVSIMFDGKIHFQAFIDSISTSKLEDQAVARILKDPRTAHMKPEKVKFYFHKFSQIGRIAESDGHIDRNGVKQFYHELHGYDPTPEDLDEALRIVDNDGNPGAVNFVEFLAIFAVPRSQGGQSPEKQARVTVSPTPPGIMPV